MEWLFFEEKKLVRPKQIMRSDREFGTLSEQKKNETDEKEKCAPFFSPDDTCDLASKRKPPHTQSALHCHISRTIGLTEYSQGLLMRYLAEKACEIKVARIRIYVG